MGEDVTPTLISQYAAGQVGSTQDRLNVIQTVAVEGFGETGAGYWQNGIQTIRAEGENRPSRPSNVIVTEVYKKGTHPHNKEEGQGWEKTEVNDTLNAFENGENRTTTLVLENHPADSRMKICENGVFQTLSSRMGTGGNNVPMVMEEEVLCVGNGQLNQSMSDKAGAINCMHDQQAVMVSEKSVRSFYPQMKAESICYQEDDISNTLVNGTNPGFHNGIVNKVVRRLTPLECERLQNLPDHWTDIGEWTDSKGKKHKDADSPRYKALGNSIALPFWQWMADRMVAQLRKDGIKNPTMASLFSGIGGFELVYTRAGCKPIWNSEIEEFPIAVTKKHFGDEDEGIEGDFERYL